MKRYIRSDSGDSTKRWVDYLPADVYSRLSACRSRKDDIVPLAQAKWAWMKANGKDKAGFTKEDALIQVLEHLDSNGQYIDPTRDEYQDMLSDII